MTLRDQVERDDCCSQGAQERSRFDLGILGGGSAAFAAARRASDLGARVLMVNQGLIGGTCVNIGCVPSKTLIRAAENHHLHGLSRFRGLEAEGGRVDFPELIREKDELVTALRQAKYTDVLSGLENVVHIEGCGRIRAPGQIEVGESVHEADRILIATGTRPAVHPILGLDDPEVWDSTKALAAASLPRRLVVLGGRYVALELGQMFARLGSQVTLVQRSAQLLPEEDLDVAEALADYLRREGIRRAYGLAGDGGGS